MYVDVADCCIKRQTLKIFPLICLTLILRCLDYLPCTCKRPIKNKFLTNLFYYCSDFQFFAALFTTLGCKEMT